MSNPKHILTNIKHEVQQNKLRNYTEANERKELKYYTLCLKEIVVIQRAYRKHLMKKGRKMEEAIYEQLALQSKLKAESEELERRRKHAEMKYIRIRNKEMQEEIEQTKQNMERSVRSMGSNFFHSLDKFAYNSASSKLALQRLKRDLALSQELGAEVKQLKLNEQCFIKRTEDWKGKLDYLRARIMEQNREIKQIQENFRHLDLHQ